MQTLPVGRTIVFLAVVLIFGLGAACTEAPMSADRETGATVTDIADNPDDYVGRTVTVAGEIEEILAPQVFRLGGEDFYGGELVVISEKPIPRPTRRRDNTLVYRDIVQVTGVVRRLNSAQLEQELGWELGPKVEKELEEAETVVVASSVLVTPRKPAG